MSGVSMFTNSSMLANLATTVVGYHAALPEQAKAEYSASHILMLVILSVAFGVLVYFAIKWRFDAETFRMRLGFRDDEIKFLKRLIETHRSIDNVLDANAPSVTRCKAMILMAAQSEGEEGRTAAMLACRLIRDERLEIVAINKS